MSRLVLLALIFAAGVQTATAQTGQFPGVMPPVPSPGPSSLAQPPIVYSPNLSGRGAVPNFMMPVEPLPSPSTVVPGVGMRRTSFIHRGRATHAHRR